ncbi:MAG: hypothetical protein IPJ61_20740 [Tessaracoccus sp.]|uniref:hypothetical protein n=1 Tax=Tessaracoccus sp. TaxID=1971211 RepID=UPI001ED3E482|nr:hypothetical protein [Tessaracoccus sp.]MBK7823417.1 hypothetical protein [Tessaracoccus sp.]
MATTTPAEIRTVIIARIAALTPPTHGANLYTAHRDDRLDLRAWAAANPLGCLRRFDVETRGDTSSPEVTMVTLEQVRETFDIVIAYPESNRFSGRRGLDDVIASDLRHIDYYAGTTGFSITPTSNATIISTQYSREQDGAVWFGVIPLEVVYWRASP